MQQDHLDILQALTVVLQTVKETDKLSATWLDKWPTYASTVEKCTEEGGDTKFRNWKISLWMSSILRKGLHSTMTQLIICWWWARWTVHWKTLMQTRHLISDGQTKFIYQARKKKAYRIGTNFRGWLNFAVFEGTSQTVKNSHGEIFVRLSPCRKMCCRWARQVREWRSFVTFVQPLTTEEKLRVLFFFAITCSLTHEYHHTTIIRKECGNYTHNKSAKIKTFKNLIIKFQQKHKIFNPTKFCTYGMQNGLPVHVAQQQVTLNWKLKKQTCLLTGISG